MIEHAQNRLLDRVRRFTGVTGFVLVLAGVAFGLATFAILTGMTPITPTSENTLLLMLLNGAVLLVLALLIFGQILFLLIERRNGTPGASLQLRLVSLFSVIAVVPAIVASSRSLLMNVALFKSTWATTLGGSSGWSTIA